MKRRNVSTLIALLAVISMSAAEVNLIPDPDFKNRGKWNLKPEHKIVANSGREGNNAIVAERSDPTAYSIAGITVPMETLDRNAEYEFGVQIKTQPLAEGKAARASVVVQFFKQGKYISETWKHVAPNSNDWTLTASTFNIPPETDRVFFAVLIPRGAVGKAWFSNPYIRPKSLTFVSALLLPHQPQALLEGNHDFTLGCYTLSLPAEYKNAALAVKVNCRKDGVPFKELTLPLAKERVAFKLDELKEGAYSFETTLLAPDRKTALGAARPILVRVHRQAPETFVRIDERGRTWVHGKKILPLGIYTNVEGLTKKSPETAITYQTLYDDIVKSPFNWFLPYDGLGTQNYKKVLDMLHENNKMVMISFSHRRDRLEDYKKMVANMKDHPAILGWYIADEVLPEKHEWLKERTEVINELDPWHPTYAVYCLFDRGSLARYAGTANVFGVDPYPIQTAKTKDLGNFNRTYRSIREILDTPQGIALWAVPQWFSWAGYKSGDVRHLYRWPTEAEALTQALIAASNGARGFTFYCYHNMRGEKNFPELWEQICRVAENLNELAPYLLGDAPGPQLKIREQSASAGVAAYTADDGRIAVVVTCDNTAPGKAVFSVPGNPALVSKFGHTKKLASGEWSFEADKVCSDILYQP